MTVRPDPTTPLRRRDLRTDLGQTAIVAVLAVTLVVGIIGTTLVATVLQSLPLQQSAAVSVYAHRALQAGENAYVTAVNANPSLAQCNTGTNGTGLCGGIDYGKWNEVTGSAGTPGSPTDGFAEWYAFGNPQPTFDPTSHALTNLAVQVVGAAHNPNTSTNYIFDSETMNLAAKNGFLNNVWWSNYESYNASGSYTNCNYNWKLGYNINGGGSGCSPVYFGPNDYLFGPVYTNDSVFVSGNGAVSGSPSFGTSIVTPTVPSAVVTADPNCQFVDATNGMSGSPSNCSAASNDVALYNHLPSDPSPHSSFNNTVQPPPQTDAQLGLIAGQNGCLYSGPTQITLKPNAGGVGQMSVISPDTPERNITVNGSPVTQDANNIATNYNDCPNDGTYTNLPPNGVVFVQNAKAGQTVVGANPFDDYLNNTVTNLAATPSPPTAGNSVLLTATITSASNQIASGATVAFSQTTRSGSTTSSAVIPACSNVSNWTAPVASGSNWTSTVTCPTTESANGTGAFSAAYSGGNSTTASQANLGQTNTLTPSLTYGANSQTNAGGCSACYFGESSNADSEGDAFVNGSVSGQLTIGTDNNVVIDGNITYADCSGQWVTGQSGEANSFCPYQVGGINDSLGLIANEYVEINHPVASPGGPVLAACGSVTGVLCDPSNSGSGLTIDAAILALTQSFTVNNFGVANTNYNVTIGGTPYTGNTEGPLAVYGSIQQFARGPIGTFCGFNPARPTNACSSFSASGYVKHYTWNPLLDLASPPSYLTPSTAPWSLTSVNSNGGTHSTAVCPALTGIYAGPPPATPAPFNDYCSKADGGLPGYPASTAPAPPTNVSATASIGGTATVTWTDPPPTVSPITNYTVSSIPPCTTCSGLTVVGATATSATVTGLVPGTAYVFVVSATNALGTSDVSSPSPSVTVPSVPYAPTLVSAVGNVNDTVTVTWTDPSSVGSPISQYTITPSPACPGCTGLVVPGATATSTTISGLTVGGSYSFTVSATNGLGVGPASMPSNTVVVPTSPGPPLAVSGTSFANTQSVVSWSAPASTGGLPITGYAVTSSPGNKTCTTAGIPSCTVNGLTNGTAYTFKVTATNAIGTGPASAPSGPATPSTLPGAPVIGTATNGVDSATVSFGAPASNGGAPITGYTVTSSPGGVTATCASSPCTVSGLTADHVHLQGHGHQRVGHRAVVGFLQRHHRHRPARRTDRGVGDLLRQRPVRGQLDGAVQRGLAHHQLHRHLQRGADLHDGDDQLHGDGTDQRHHLHLHGDRHQRAGYRRPVGGGHGHPRNGPRCTHHRHRHGRLPFGHRHLVGTVVQRGTPGHRLHRHVQPGGVHAGRVFDRPHRELDQLHLHRPHQRHQLHLHGQGHQRGGHRARLVPVEPYGSGQHGARRTVERERHLVRQHPVGRVVDRGRGQRLGHHRLHRHLQPRGPDMHHSRDLLHRQRAHQRHRLHLHGDGNQRHRRRPGVGTLVTGHPVHRARRAHLGDRHLLRQRPVVGVVDRARLQRRGGHHHVHGHLEPLGSDLHDQHDLLHGGHADQRDQLHVHGDGHQRIRHRTGLGRLAGGGPGHGARPAHRGGGHVERRQPVRGHLVGPRLHRRRRHHQLHRDRDRRSDLHHAQRVHPDLYGHRAHQRHLLSLHGDGHQRRRHREPVRALGARHPGDPARRADRRDRPGQPRLPVDRDLDPAGLERWSGDHRLHRHGQQWADLRDARRGDHDLHGPRTDQRDDLHVHGDGHQRTRHGSGLRRLEPGDPRGHAGRSHRGDGLVLRRQPVRRGLDGPGLHRRLSHHQLHSHGQQRADLRDGQRLDHLVHAARPHQRDHLHLHGGRHQQHR
jgi:hypothetical protein